jgi:3,5-epimerase/4-reductase
MNKDVLILGKGFIGDELQKGLNCRIDGSAIKRFSDAQRLVAKYRPKTVINCIGVIGRRNVGDCELKKDETLLANSFVPVMLAEACLRRGIKLVHISSGCIFNYDYKKNAPLKESSRDYFLNLFYARSKIYADAALEPLAEKFNVLIARVRIPLLNTRHPKNILDKLIKYRKVIDVPNSVTYIPDFVRAIKHLLKVDARGVYNVVNKGGLRYPDLMKAYQKYSPGFKFEVIDFKKLGIERTNLLLSVKKLEGTGFKVRHINSVLDECVKCYKDSM